MSDVTESKKEKKHLLPKEPEWKMCSRCKDEYSWLLSSGLCKECAAETTKTNALGQLGQLE